MEFYIALLAMNHPAQVSLLIEISFQTLRDYAQYMVPNNNDNHHPSSNQSSSSSDALGDAIMEFYIALLAMNHPAQVSLLIETYFQTLRDYDEYMVPNDNDNNHPSSPNPSSRSRNNINSPTNDEIHTHYTVVSSRRLRLRAIHSLSSVPGFVSINYPLNYPDIGQRKSRNPVSWTRQILADNLIVEEDSNVCPYPDALERVPRSHWLAELLSYDGFLICAYSCDAGQAPVPVTGGEGEGSNPRSSRNPGTPTRSNSTPQNPPPTQTPTLTHNTRTLNFHSLAVDSITCVYESLLRRHAVDQRYQSDEGRKRIAAMFVNPILQSTIIHVDLLARMDATHKARCIWLLCFLHMLQEAPEFLIREQLRIYCNPKKFYLHKFVRLLKLCSLSFQCFIDQTRCSEREHNNNNNNERNTKV
eukprot:CAMPEP_0194397706 /NCGR_PEP_ID=MMETSP0174-20130528/125693_1 /TAXON_ID=216777 /ORGANISM="Proboscia alata, Strain PI-D3" /LENGTH=415 /DNA_ID=CAMNT_0039193913 /DNA_START=674 /DNA_END=1917 /DNA_ORIENTATION=-